MEEIASMALDLVDKTSHFVIPHMPERNLEIRAGFNSGSCVAGLLKLNCFFSYHDFQS